MTQHILVKVHYNEEKKQIICYFKNSLGQEAKRFPFTPYIKIPKQLNKISNLLNELKIKNFFIEENKVFANISVLKQISKVIAQLTNKKLVVLNLLQNL